MLQLAGSHHLAELWDLCAAELSASNCTLAQPAGALFLGRDLHYPSLFVATSGTIVCVHIRLPAFKASRNHRVSQAVSEVSLQNFFQTDPGVSLFISQKNRYEIYVGLLKEGVKELLSGVENDAPGLKKSHSSPSLNQESPVSAKVKRNVSERKDYRPETPSIKQKVT